MKTIITLLVSIAMLQTASAGCYYDPSGASSTFYKVVGGHFLYDSVNNIYYKRPGDTVDAIYSIGGMYSGACMTYYNYFYNDSSFNSNPNTPRQTDTSVSFSRIALPGRYKYEIDMVGVWDAYVILDIRDSVFAVTGIEEAHDDDPFIKVLGNPFASTLQLSYIPVTGRQLTYTLYNTLGTAVLSGTRALSPGLNAVSIATDYLSAGVYILTISEDNADKVRTVRVVKM